LALFALTATLCMGLTFTGSLVAGAWVPVLGWAYLVKRNGERRRAAPFFGTCLVLLATVAACYVWLTGASTLEHLKSYYDTQEIAWPTGYTAPVLATWLASSVKGAAFYVLGVVQDWPPLSWCVATLELLAAGLSIGYIWKRCRPLCVALAILGVEAVVVAALRIWPLGRMRHVTYLIPLVSVFIGCGLWQFVRRVGWSPATVGLLGLCIGLPLLRSAESTLITPRTSEHLRPVLEHVRNNLQPGDAVFVYYGASDAFEYYGDFNETLREPDDLGPPRFVRLDWNAQGVPVLVQPCTDRENERAFADRFDAWIGRHPRVWFLFAHNWRNERQEWVADLETRYRLIDERLANNASAHLFERYTVTANR
jgi:hypothetical protein